MKHLILCLLCIIIIYARDDSLAYKNVEFYEQKPYLIGDDTDRSIDEKYSIYDSGWG